VWPMLLPIASLVSALPAVGPPQRSVELVIRDSAGCLDAADVQRGISDTLELDIAASPDTQHPWRLEVQAARGQIGFVASIVVQGDVGQEKRRKLELEHPSCQELRDAVVLVSALLLDELWADDRTLHAPVPPPRPPASVETQSRHPWTVSSTLVALLAVGDLPRVAGGFGLRVAFDAPQAVGFSLGVQAWPRRDIRDSTGAGARFSGYEIALALCPRIVTRLRFELLACGGARAGIIHVRGLGLASTQGIVTWRTLADAALGVRVRVGGPMWVVAAVGVGVPLVRDRFTYIANDGESVALHRSWPAVPMVEVGLAVRGSLLQRALGSPP